ncbi:MAG: hypothetical protein BIFFINMI_01284 [Phycisphaerae bacterium]|nr:hypothetical protein [Phycisphaerae bacterium]
MPGRPVKYIELAKELQRRISGGRYTGAMPGVQRLAKELGVDPKTAWRAMDLLVGEGVLYRPNPRRTYVSQSSAATSAGPGRRPTSITLINSYQSRNRPDSPFQTQFISGVRQACRRHHVPADIRGSETPLGVPPHPRFTRRVIESMPPGTWAVFLGSTVDAAGLRALRRRDIHAVFADDLSANGLHHTITFDWRSGMIELMQRLGRLGHRRIGLVLAAAGSGDNVNSQSLEGVRLGLEQLDIALERCPQTLTDESHLLTAEQVADLLDVNPPPTALVSKMASYDAIRRGARMVGLRIPSRLSVVMIGGASYSSAPPSVARLSGDGKAMGRMAVDTLLAYADRSAVVHVRVIPFLRAGRSLTHAPAEG